MNIPVPSASEYERSDGRSHSKFRRTVFDIGMLASASGSAYIEIGTTKVICSIHGPRAIPSRGSIFSDRGQFVCDFRYAPFASAYFSSSTSLTSLEREMARSIENALESTIPLEKYPKSIISAHVIVLQDCGGVLAASCTCASLALMDAAVEQYDLITSTQVASIDGKIFLDPTENELKKSSGNLTLSCTSCNDITQLLVFGRIEADTFAEMRSLAFSGCAFLRSLVGDKLREKIKSRSLESV